jgi:hypothetical protein
LGDREQTGTSVVDRPASQSEEPKSALSPILISGQPFTCGSVIACRGAAVESAFLMRGVSYQLVISTSLISNARRLSHLLIFYVLKKRGKTVRKKLAQSLPRAITKLTPPPAKSPAQNHAQKAR